MPPGRMDGDLMPSLTGAPWTDLLLGDEVVVGALGLGVLGVPFAFLRLRT